MWNFCALVAANGIDLMFLIATVTFGPLCSQVLPSLSPGSCRIVSNSKAPVLYQYLDDLWVSQKTLWTGARTICTGLENHYQIAWFGNGQCHAVCQNIQWRA